MIARRALYLSMPFCPEPPVSTLDQSIFSRSCAIFFGGLPTGLFGFQLGIGFCFHLSLQQYRLHRLFVEELQLLMWSRSATPIILHSIALSPLWQYCAFVNNFMSRFRAVVSTHTFQNFIVRSFQNTNIWRSGYIVSKKMLFILFEEFSAICSTHDYLADSIVAWDIWCQLHRWPQAHSVFRILHLSHILLRKTMMHIEHCRKSAQFFMKIGGHRPLLQYRRLPNSVLEVTHSEVPPDLRRKGIAEQLCKELFKYAKAENFKILPTCSYFHRYVTEWATAEERKLIVNGASHQNQHQ